MFEPDGEIDVESVGQPDHIKASSPPKSRTTAALESYGGGKIRSQDLKTTDLMPRLTTRPRFMKGLDYDEVSEVASRFHLKRRVVLTDSSHFMAESGSGEHTFAICLPLISTNFHQRNKAKLDVNSSG